MSTDPQTRSGYIGIAIILLVLAVLFYLLAQSNEPQPANLRPCSTIEHTNCDQR